MVKRRNEIESMIRNEPFSYRTAYDANSNVLYEGWAVPGALTSAAVWIIATHEYDASNRITATLWAQTTGSPPADFDQIWDNRTSLTYV